MTEKPGTIYVASDGSEHANRASAAFHDLAQNLDAWQKANPNRLGCDSWLFANVFREEGVQKAVAQYIADTKEGA